MVVNCREALNAGARRVARGLRLHRPRGAHGHAHRALFGPPAPAAPPACSDSDAPFRALRQPAPPGQAGPGALGKAARVAAATAAAGTGAGLGYWPLAGAPGFGPQRSSPGLAQVPQGQSSLGQVLTPQLASSNVPSFVMPPGANDTLPFLPVAGTTPPSPVPGATPTAVAEPASVLLLGMTLLAFALIRGQTRGGSGGVATGRSL